MIMCLFAAILILFNVGCGSVENRSDASIEPKDTGPAGFDASGPDALIVSHRVFISKASFNGNLGGLPGADAKCQTAAEGAGFSGLWRAYLSTTITDARDRIPSVGRFVRVTGEVIANDRTDLFDGTIQAPILFDESGTERTPNRAWTGSAANGTLIANENCTDWTLGTTTSVPGLIGDATATDAAWTHLQSSGCGGMQRLFCFEQ
jgi:hypothetical protein